MTQTHPAAPSAQLDTWPQPLDLDAAPLFELDAAPLFDLDAAPLFELDAAPLFDLNEKRLQEGPCTPGQGNTQPKRETAGKWPN